MLREADYGTRWPVFIGDFRSVSSTRYPPVTRIALLKHNEIDDKEKNPYDQQKYMEYYG
jgi:hypothetical protein